MKSLQKAQEKEIAGDESLSNLITDLDIIYSRYIRLREADLYGNVKCFTCDKVDNWKRMDCGHFIGRGHMFLRFDERNTKIQCPYCNRHSSGNLIIFSQRLELEHPGIVEILYEEAKMVHKYSREELKLMIADYSNKLKKIS